MKGGISGWLLAVLACAPACGADPPSITTATLLDEMVDTVRLGNFPDPPYRTIQFSSYDRRSSVPGGPDWFANSDGFGGEPIANFEAELDAPNAQGVGRYLVCDVNGPGAIVRTWSAAIEGTLRVVLDEQDTPIFEGSAQEFLQEGLLRAWEEAGVPRDMYEGTFRQQDACYLPIPFARRCRIEWIGDTRRIHFYEVQLRLYPQAARVTGLRREALPTLAPHVLRIAEILRDPAGRWTYHAAEPPTPVQLHLAPHAVGEMLTLEGPAAIERLTLQVAATDLDRALRQTVLRITFDDHASSQVCSPLGDFFGAAPGINPFSGVPLDVAADGAMTCRFVMPFAHKCVIGLENRGDQEVAITGSVLTLPWDWQADRSMHFRARWRVDHDLIARPGAGAQDLPFLLAHGTGVYVGTAVMLLNPNPIPTPYGSWWGEGDEKIFVDDDVQPSTFGTGSEDYFNYSWSAPDLFLHAYCGQPRNDGPANRGFVVNHRWHILDAIPFQRRMAFYMELYSHTETTDFSYARIAYHYGRPGIVDDSREPTAEDLRPLKLPANWQPVADFGARNAVFHQAEQLVVDGRNTAMVPGDLWSGGAMLLWNPATNSDELAFDLPVAAAGKYAIHVVAAQSPRSARVVASLNGNPLRLGGDDGAADLTSEFHVQSRNFTSPDVELSAGQHRLKLRVAPDSPTRPLQDVTVGIDFIWVQKR